MAFLLVPLVILGLIALVLVGLYNGLVRARTATDAAWSGIDTELKRRHDLVPNLVETVKGYASHERSTLEAVTRARTAAAGPHDSPAAVARDEKALAASLRQIFALSERYPDLKANVSFQELQAALAETENRIQRARGVFNAHARDLNTRIQVFPSNLVAGPFGFQPRDYFELEADVERQPPKVSFT